MSLADTRHGSVASAQQATVDSRRRRLHVMHLVYIFGVGGAELGILKLVNLLDPSRFMSSICSCCPADPNLRPRPGVLVFQFNRRRIGQDPGLIASLYALLRRERPDVVHTHGWGTLFEGFVAARAAGVPVIIHSEHGTLETRPRNVRVQRWLWSRFDQLLCVSSCTADEMAREIGFPAGRIATIRNGVDLARFSPGDGAEARSLLGLGADELVIGRVARLVPVKDYDNLLVALAILKRDGLPFKAVLAGDGPLKTELTTRVQALGLDPHVRFLGNRSDTERVLKTFDLFVQNSASEGLSNTILEAMATSLPVVATHVGGTNELVRHAETGLLVPPGKPQALADALLTLATDSMRRNLMGAAGRRRVEAHFSLDGMIRSYETMYLHLARRHPKLGGLEVMCEA